MTPDWRTQPVDGSGLPLDEYAAAVARRVLAGDGGTLASELRNALVPALSSVALLRAEGSDPERLDRIERGVLRVLEIAAQAAAQARAAEPPAAALRRYAPGDRIRYTYGPLVLSATVLSDRGPLGFDGTHLYRLLPDDGVEERDAFTYSSRWILGLASESASTGGV